MSNIVSLVVRLVDQVSGIAPRVIGSVKGIARAAEGLGKVSGSIDRTVTRLAAATLAAGGLVRTAHAIGRVVGSAVRGAADFDDELQGIAQTGGLSVERLAQLRAQLLALAPILGRKPGDIAEGLLAPFVAAGLDDVTAEALLAPLGRVAVGQRAALKDISGTAIALVKNLKIPVDEIEKTFDGLAKAGKLGRFELKDMAHYMPVVASMAANLGMSGRSAALELAAALQITRDAAGGPSQAANNLSNLLQKLQSPETVRKFSKAGIDIKASIEKGMEAGRSPLETVIVATQEALKKNKGLTIGDLFSDLQVQQALGPLVRNFDEFKRIRAEVSEATGVIAADFEAMSKTTKAAFDQLNASSESLSRTWGEFLAPAARTAASAVTALSVALQGFMKEYPALSRVLAYGAGALVLAVAGFTALGTALVGIAGAIALLKLAGFGAGGGLLLRALAGWVVAKAGFVTGLVSGLLGTFVGVIQGIAAGLLPHLGALGALLLRGLMAAFGVLTGPVGWALLAASLAWTFRAELMAAFSKIGAWLAELGQRIAAAFQSLNLGEAGAKVIASLLAGLQSAAERVISWATGFVGRLKSLFSFSVSPSIAPRFGSGLTDGPPAATPQSAPGGLAPAPRMRHASVTNHNVFHIDGADPERAARQIVTALDRYRQAGMFDGAPA